MRTNAIIGWVTPGPKVTSNLRTCAIQIALIGIVSIFAVILGSSSSMAQPTYTAGKVDELSTLYRSLPKGTTVYTLDSLVIHDGDSIVVFSSASSIKRAADRLIVTDPESGQSYTFPNDSAVSYEHGGSKVIVQPGEQRPKWLPRSSKGELFK